MSIKSTFYPNQIEAAKKIFKKFSEGESNYDMLSAQMQSGKTGVSLYLAFEMLTSKIVKKVYIISGNSEKQLKEQWEEKIKSHVDDYITYNSEWAKLVDELLGDGRAQENLINNIEVIWRQDLMKERERFSSEYLIIWDESHYATTEEQTLHKFFNETKLMESIQGNTTYMKDNKIFMSSVTATRCAEQSRQVHYTTSFTQTIMTPQESYRGLEYFKVQGLIKTSYPLNMKNREKISQIIDVESIQNKLMLIRTNNSLLSHHKGAKLLKQICVEKKIKYIEYTASTQKEHNELWTTEPTEFTIVRIAGLFRMGKELNKKHICAVYESSAENQEPKALQNRQTLCGRNLATPRKH